MSLPVKQAEAIEALVASGRYASAGEVVRAALDALNLPREDDPKIERWLREKVVPTYHAMQADPGRGRTVEEVRASIEAHHAKRMKCRA